MAVVVVVVVAACAPSQAVVSTMKLPFLSWHLHQVPTPKRQRNSHFLNKCIHTLQVDESEDTRICLPSEPSLHRPTSDDTVALVWVVDHTSVLHQVQQFARAQIDRLAPFCLTFLAFKIELDLHRQLRGRETVTRRCHCVLGGFQLNQSLRRLALELGPLATKCPRLQQGDVSSVRLKKRALMRYDCIVSLTFQKKDMR